MLRNPKEKSPRFPLSHDSSGCNPCVTDNSEYAMEERFQMTGTAAAYRDQVWPVSTGQLSLKPLIVSYCRLV